MNKGIIFEQFLIGEKKKRAKLEEFFSLSSRELMMLIQLYHHFNVTLGRSRFSRHLFTNTD